MSVIQYPGYYRAMDEVESRSGLGGDAPARQRRVLILLDALHSGTLNDAPREIVQILRIEILALDIDCAPGNENEGSSAEAV